MNFKELIKITIDESKLNKSEAKVKNNVLNYIRQKNMVVVFSFKRLAIPFILSCFIGISVGFFSTQTNTNINLETEYQNYALNVILYDDIMEKINEQQ
ncbi:MAG: hypothetical protein BWY78_01189 [Alphaproteobacteria bacterium ADurb.Bin438]|nr:MAG: hypothetical protein BWY78_01189 [Alphaproteobacteria bacterium ADurb.Bin438]